jgi:adenosylcobinamide-phosphate synthase
MFTAVSISIAVLLDTLLGEPRRCHPLALFGRWAHWWELRLYGMAGSTAIQQQLRGSISWLCVVSPLVLIVVVLEQIPGLNAILAVIWCYLALGGKSLVEHARQVEQAMLENNIVLARERVAMMVSRDTSSMDASAINKATIESVLENGNDAIFGTIFWFVLLGAPGVVLYRLGNTLDAMWGYRNERYNFFGRFAARVDDLMNWLPARLTALSYAMMGHPFQALQCWRQQAAAWSGINPGVVMASGAGALVVRLGGRAIYHGRQVLRPELGVGLEPQAYDIERAIGLVQRSQWLWVIILLIGGWVIA